MAIIVPTIDAQRVKIEQVRNATKAIILAATDNLARVHATWKLKADIGKEASILKRKTDQRIHSWMIGLGSNLSETSETGFYPRVGGRVLLREIRLIIWGFYDYTLFDLDADMSSQQFAENESELIADYFAANPRLDLNVATVKGLRGVKPFQIENMDVHSFGEGIDCHVVQCSMNVLLNR